MNCNIYAHNDPFGGTKYISGTTCDGTVGYYYLTIGQSICMDDDRPVINLNNLQLSGSCFPVTPTPSTTPLENCYFSAFTYTTTPYQCPNNGLTYYDTYGKYTLYAGNNGIITSQHPDLTFTFTNGSEYQTVTILSGEEFVEFVYPKINFFYTDSGCVSTTYPDWYIYTPPVTKCSLATPTPTVTPTITPSPTTTLTATPTKTPTNTPTNTNTPTPSTTTPLQVVYSQITMQNGQVFDAGTFTINYNGSNTETYQTLYGYQKTACLTSAIFPQSGYTYSFRINYPSNYITISDGTQPASDRIDFVVGASLGDPYGAGETWTGQTIYYLNNVVVGYGNPTNDILSWLAPINRQQYNGCLYSLEFSEMVLGPQWNFVYVTPTPTTTPTPTRPIYAYYTSLNGFASLNGACDFGQSCDRVVYSFDNPLKVFPQTRLYSDSTMTTPFNGGGLRWALSLNCNGIFYAATVQTDGDIQNINTLPCNPGLTPTVTPTNTNTPTVTSTNTQTPSVTPTNTSTVTPTNTTTKTQTPTNTTTPTKTPTNTTTPTKTPTSTPTKTPTSTPTYYYYRVQIYTSSCSATSTFLNIRTISPRTINWYYCYSADGVNRYKVLSTLSPSGSYTFESCPNAPYDGPNCGSIPVPCGC